MPRRRGGFMAVLRPRPLDLVLLVGVILLGMLLAGPVLTIPLRIPINYDEGWNAAFDARAAMPGLEPLYPGPDSLVFNNYPPLGFLLVGGLGRFVFGDMIVAGRTVALAALVAAAGLTGLCVRLSGGTAHTAAATAVLLLLFACSFYRGYVAMDDPQWLAQALMLAGLAVLLRGEVGCRLRNGEVACRLRNGKVAYRLRGGELPWPRILGSALLMLAGGFVKHSLVALPAATTLWLLWLDRRAALVWAAAVGTGLALGLLVTWAWFGNTAFVDVLDHHRVFRLRLLIHAAGGVAPLLPMLVVVAMRGHPDRDGAMLAMLFIGIALVSGIVQRCGEGVNYNAHLETLVALCLGFGLSITPKRGTERRWRGLSAATSCVLAALPVLGAMPWSLPAAWHDVADRHALQAAWRPIIARLADAGGPVGCEMQSLCYWAGRPFAVDVFNLTQSALARNTATGIPLASSPVTAFQCMVERHRFALFEYQPRSATHAEARRLVGRDPVMDAFDGGYAPVTAGPGGALLLAPLAAPADRAPPSACGTPRRIVGQPDQWRDRPGHPRDVSSKEP